MMEQHFIASVLNRNIVVDFAVRIDTHTRQCIVIRSELFLYEVIIFSETMIYRMEVFFFATRKLHVIIRTVIRKNIAVFLMNRRINMPLFINTCRHKLKFL